VTAIPHGALALVERPYDAAALTAAAEAVAALADGACCTELSGSAGPAELRALRLSTGPAELRALRLSAGPAELSALRLSAGAAELSALRLSARPTKLRALWRSTRATKLLLRTLRGTAATWRLRGRALRAIRLRGGSPRRRPIAGLLRHCGQRQPRQDCRQ
jgi:hypothetical protein